jgi:hypothetical protein
MLNLKVWFNFEKPATWACIQESGNWLYRGPGSGFQAAENPPRSPLVRGEGRRGIELFREKTKRNNSNFEIRIGNWAGFGL